MADEMTQPKGKNPMMWVIVAVVVIVIIAGLAFYLNSKKSSSQQTASQDQSGQMNYGSTSSPEAASSDSSMMVGNSLVMTKTDPTKGDYLADSKGMTLYIFDKDQPGKSNCADACLDAWPLFEAPSANPANLPVNFGVVPSTNGKFVYTYKNLPLYYYVKDQKPGDVTGDGVGGVWHLVKP